MDEITLTGGTLAANADQPAGPEGVNAAHNHSHGHSHGHGGQCCHGNQGSANDYADISPSLDNLADASSEELVRALSTLLRFGRYEAVENMLDQVKETKGSAELGEVLKHFDDGGHSLFHWSAKRVDDPRFLQKFVELVVEFKMTDLLNAPSNDNVGMRPLHWACTEGIIPHVALLLKNGADMEAKDSSGCTPLLIAAQYGQVEVVAYLLKNGANIHAVDTSKDSALHWAAYKGSIQVCGLLSYYQQLDWSTQDTYGQTPVHLASLRGHSSVVRYILLHLQRKDVLFQKDKNERTPLDLAIHKNRPTVERILKEAMMEAKDPRGHFLRETLLTFVKNFFTAKTWRSWLGFTGGMDEMDVPSRFPYFFMIFNYVVHIAFFVTVFAPVANPGKGIMWDLSGWLSWNFLVAIAAWYFFYKTVTTKPGYLDDSTPTIGKWRQLYEETLESYADDTMAQNIKVQLCHTCHVARPHRSKHCRFQRKCVLLFDHFCPFVDNTVGLYNYRYFLFCLIFTAIGIVSYSITFYTYLKRYTDGGNSFPWGMFALGMIPALCGIPVSGMSIYHIQLTMVNLSTNEHMNMRKYPYLYIEEENRKKYKNPWFKGWMGNIMDRMQPSERCYVIPEDHQSLLHSKGDEIV